MIQNLDWWLFAALMPVIYWLAPGRLRLPLLAVASLGILIRLAPVDMTVMLGIGLFVYASFAGVPAPAEAGGPSPKPHPLRHLARIGQSPWLVVGIFLYLFWYKYLPAIARMSEHGASFAGIAAPIGISYLSFKLAHYAIERRGGTLPPHNIQEFLCWLFLMPTFTSGPIERFEHFLESRAVKFRVDHIVVGVSRIAQGLVKKFILSDGMMWVSERITGGDIVAFAHGHGKMDGAGPVWAYLTLDLLILYLDFSAYSDIAIGASRLFGLRIMENFNYPLQATSLPDFWRRWHMSLTNWCRVYIYMPMVGATRNPYWATIATFVVIGLWHLASLHWVAWGLWHGLGLAAVLVWGRFANRRKIKFFRSKTGKVVGWAATMAYVIWGGGLLAIVHEGSLLDSFALMARALGL